MLTRILLPYILNLLSGGDSENFKYNLNKKKYFFDLEQKLK